MWSCGQPVELSNRRVKSTAQRNNLTVKVQRQSRLPEFENAFCQRHALRHLVSAAMNYPFVRIGVVRIVDSRYLEVTEFLRPPRSEFSVFAFRGASARVISLIVRAGADYNLHPRLWSLPGDPKVTWGLPKLITVNIF
jgi:hypothetical protein